MKSILIPGLILAGLVVVSTLVISTDNLEYTTPHDVELPVATGFVNDYANVIDDANEAILEAQLKEASETGTVEIAILTVETMNGQNIEEYSMSVAESWRVGDKETDNGILFVTSTGDRRTRIEIGMGAEGIINDSKAGRIIDDNAIPSFKVDDYQTGIINTTNALISEMSNN